MHQSLCTIALEIEPSNLEALRGCITDLIKAVKDPPANKNSGDKVFTYQEFSKAVPDLHYMSIMIFEDARYDPLVTIELNADGDISTVLPQLEASPLGPFLRALIRCCKRPFVAERAAMYDAITPLGSKLPITPFLDACIVEPAAFHQGNRGLNRNRIRTNKALFEDVQRELTQPELCRLANAADIHKALRSALAPKHLWLNSPDTPRWTARERIGDYARLAIFLIVALFLFSLPGVLLALLMPASVAIVISYLAIFFLWRQIPNTPPRTGQRDKKPAQSSDPSVWLQLAPAFSARVVVSIAVFLIAYAAAAAALFTALATDLGFGVFSELYGRFFIASGVGILTAPLPVLAALAWLRWLEEREPVHDDPRDDAERLRSIRALENEIEQNHMGSMVLLKTGTLRALLVRAGIWGLGYLLRVTATDGYLASMRTIHFAHWAIVSNGSRLVFFSNFDGTWESYLDDFIEKAHEGLTAAWTNGIGFPYTRFLIGEGASKGRLFKAWARHSMTENLFWFRAYDGLSVNQIERQHRIASGLRKPALSGEEAKTWAWDL